MPDEREPDSDGSESPGEPAGRQGTEDQPLVPSDAETETVVIAKDDPQPAPDAAGADAQTERRFTAPGFDAKETQVMATAPEAATEVIHTQQAPAVSPPPPPSMAPKPSGPQSIPGRSGGKATSFKPSKWGWVLAIVVIVLALTAIAILGTVLLTRSKHSKASQEDQVRQVIQTFDGAVQRGDLTALRSITCGTTRDGYVDYDEHSWTETYQRVSAAKQYPVIATIDQVVVNGQHAEANVTTFMAYDPQVRSTRSLDLQFRDDQWKICQPPSS
ncbi:membrane protein [Mycobacterium kubicae]|uniref:Membrane protein n=1 Tax=Mycobacterium kubicae TaxID=120959 RepID=A0AAX1JAU2_9MYCO|nr:hypothetical protein [Mycobacterium kubicae]MCV7098043.1 hypothetical protein [Mycobacterium kubicae]ORW05554.1 hypothetical protein AWC13_25675 [Mycobacterium kubicae]QNI10412.1 hypothetical protein GAN18_03595 [Mycobacterium kubicae]QPI38619.1 hypothetical protein I2456_03515 [Mycobacterium kubicae]GFG63558.1 membrane protein [Mycobacterium kubicae]